jgi:putative oxidoreductase
MENRASAFLGWVSRSSAPRATVLIRIVVGWVFLSEGIQKFLFPEALGAGRFLKIGIPAPEVMGPFVGVVEIIGGSLLVLGLLTRVAALALLVDILVAIATTKVPMLFRTGFWSTVHEARTDLSMAFCLVYLLMVGAGSASLDARFAQRGPA